jgi:hypothetical protein
MTPLRLRRISAFLAVHRGAPQCVYPCFDLTRRDKSALYPRGKRLPVAGLPPDP